MKITMNISLFIITLFSRKNEHFFVIDFVDGKINMDRNKNIATHMEWVMGKNS